MHFHAYFAFSGAHLWTWPPLPTMVSLPTQSLREAYLRKWKHCMLPRYVCLQDMCLCIFFGIRRCNCLFLFVFWLVCCWCLDVICFHLISVLSWFFFCTSFLFCLSFLSFYWHIFHDGFNCLDVVNASVCLCSVAVCSPLRAEHHHRGRGGGVPASL